MHTIWPRTAGTDGASHIKVCLTASRSVARQSKPTGRKTTASDAFIACYSSRPGTATVSDAKTTEHRRRDLDRRLNKARASLPCMPGADRAAFTGESSEEPWTMENTAEGGFAVLWSICSSQAQLKHHRRSMDARCNYLSHLHQEYGLPRWTKGRRRDAFDHGELENAEGAQINEEHDRVGPYRNPRTEHQVAQAASSVMHMVDELMKEGYNQRFRGDTLAASSSMQNPDSSWNNIRMVRSSGYPRYNATEVDPASASRALNRANDVTRGIFAKWEQAQHEEEARNEREGLLKKRLKKLHGIADDENGDPAKRLKLPKIPLAVTMLSKICFNLHVQRFLPDIHTYNTLLLGFTRVREHRLAEIVAESFFHNSKLRPTGQTIISLLLHYQASDDILSFYHLIRRIIGMDSNGVKIRRMFRAQAMKSRHNISWAQSPSVAPYKSFLVERWSLDAELLETIVKGLISFDQGQHAAQVLSLSLTAGCAVNSQTLIDLLELITSRIDYAAASVLVRGLCANLDDTISLLMADDCPELVPDRLRQGLDLYALHLALKPTAESISRWSRSRNMAKEGRIIQLLNETLPRRPGTESDSDADAPEFEHLLLALWINETTRRLQILETIINQAEWYINIIHEKGTIHERGSWHSLLGNIDILSHFDIPLAYPSAVARHRWLSAARVHIITSRFEDSLEAIEAYQRDFLAVAEEGMSARVRNHILSPGFPLAKQVRLYMKRFHPSNRDDVLAGPELSAKVLARSCTYLTTWFKRSLASSMTTERREAIRVRHGGAKREVPVEVFIDAISQKGRRH